MLHMKFAKTSAKHPLRRGNTIDSKLRANISEKLVSPVVCNIPKIQYGIVTQMVRGNCVAGSSPAYPTKHYIREDDLIACGGRSQKTSNESTDITVGTATTIISVWCGRKDLRKSLYI